MELQLSKTKISAIIDAEDIDKILKHNTKWYLSFSSGKLSSVRSYSKILGKTISLARAVLGYYGAYQIDHINRNPLDNRKDNLRLCSGTENSSNRGKMCKTTHSKFKCVHYHKRWNIYYACVGHKGRYYSKKCNSEIEAAKEANRLMQKYHGNFAVLNSIPEEN